MKESWSLLFSISCCALSNSIVSTPALAQVSADGTTNTTVNGDGNGNFTIEQGDRAGNNLFHSFGNFSVPTNGSAFFNNASDVSNIFSRVTGGNISNIDGLIQANGSANLFLINPAGILFGNNARLDIGGSFLGTTADSILFEDGTFSATDLDNPPLLTVNAPIGLNFRDNPGEIVNTSVSQNPNGETNITGGAVGLQVPEGKTLALVGGNVLLDDGNLTAKGGHIEMGSVRDGTVGIIETDTGFTLDYSEINSFDDITLQNTAVVDITASGGGSIDVTAENLTLDTSSILSGIAPDSTFSDAQAGDVNISANESVSLNDGNIFNDVNTDAVGNAGNIHIIANSLSLENGAIISSDILGRGNGGKITINADKSVIIGTEESNGFLFSNIYFGAVGNSGGIEINTGSLSLSNSSQMRSQVEGTGNSGDININAQGKVSFDGRDETDSFPSAIFTSVEPTGEGNGGNINIQAESLEITNRAQFLSNVEGIGDGGDINIQVLDEVRLVNSILISEVTEPDENGEGGRGDAGDINITTGSLLLQDGSALLADTENIGDAGSINIEAQDRVVLEGEGFSASTNSTDIVFSQISTTSESSVSGKSGNINISANELSIDEGFISSSTFSPENAGNVNIFANNLFLTNGGQINSFTNGSGNAGNIFLNISDTILFGGQDQDGFSSGLSATVGEEATGSGGNIVIRANTLIAKEGGQISASNLGSGTSGIVDISGDEILLDGESLEGFNSGVFSTIEPNASGTAGDINISATNLTITNGAEIDVSTFGEGDGGNIDIEVEDTITLDGQGLLADGNGFVSDSGIFANVETGASGNGGDINISSGNLIISNGAEIDVGSEAQGDGGNLFVSTNTLSLNSGSILSSTGFGEGGNIELNVADNITLENNSLISAQAFNDADGGNLTIDANFIIGFPNEIPGDGSDIIASAEAGDGGNISITAESLLGIEEGEAIEGNGTNDIDASSDFGLDGTISIFTPDINPIQGATELPSNIVEPNQAVAQACNNNRGVRTASSFVIDGKGGIPPLPDAPMNSETITVNGATTAKSSQSYAISTGIGDITPARGVIKRPDGSIVLTATPVAGNSSRVPNGSHCS